MACKVEKILELGRTKTKAGESIVALLATVGNS